jgi:hypothetical protein
MDLKLNILHVKSAFYYIYKVPNNVLCNNFYFRIKKINDNSDS